MALSNARYSRGVYVYSSCYTGLVDCIWSYNSIGSGYVGVLLSSIHPQDKKEALKESQADHWVRCRNIQVIIFKILDYRH